MRIYSKLLLLIDQNNGPADYVGERRGTLDSAAQRGFALQQNQNLCERAFLAIEGGNVEEGASQDEGEGEGGCEGYEREWRGGKREFCLRKVIYYEKFH